MNECNCISEQVRILVWNKNTKLSKRKVKMCKEHGWQKWHPNEECLICEYEKWHKQVFAIRPDWDDESNPAFENWINKGHGLGDLPRRRTVIA